MINSDFKYHMWNMIVNKQKYIRLQTWITTKTYRLILIKPENQGKEFWKLMKGTQQSHIYWKSS